MIFGSVVINYLDRSNISITASALKNDLVLSTVQMGYIFSAFSLAYALLQVPGGAMVDRVNPRKLYILIFWSLATLVQGLLRSFMGFIWTRAIIGFFEALSYPMNNRIVSAWFPEKKRASAIAVYTSGQFIGLAFLTPLLVIIQSHLGWRGLFVTSGLIGIVWAVSWYVLYRSPQDHSGVNQAELDLILQHGGIINETDADKKAQPFNWTDIRLPFSHHKLWGLYIGPFCLGTLVVFFDLVPYVSG